MLSINLDICNIVLEDSWDVDLLIERGGVSQDIGYVVITVRNARSMDRR